MFKSDLETAAAHDKPFSVPAPSGLAVPMLAPSVVFTVNDVTLARCPEHASSSEEWAKDIKGMKYWMPVTIG